MKYFVVFTIGFYLGVCLALGVKKEKE